MSEHQLLPDFGNVVLPLCEILVLEGVGSTDKICLKLKRDVGIEALGKAGFDAWGGSCDFQMEVVRGTAWRFLAALGVNHRMVHLTHVPKVGPVIRQMGPLREKQD